MKKQTTASASAKNFFPLRRTAVFLLCLAIFLTMLAGCSSSGSGSSSSASSAGSSAETSAVSSVSSSSSSSASQEVSSEEETSSSDTSESGTTEEEEVQVDEYTLESETIYEEVFGEFWDAYQKAEEETNVSMRYALMAIAEAKLMETAAFMPTTSSGAVYEVSRIAPHSTNYALWGGDPGHMESAFVVEGDPISNEDWTALKAKWYELRGTGTFKAYELEYLNEHGYTLSDTYTTTFTALPHTWDLLNTSRALDMAGSMRSVDPLIKYDCEGVQQPCLAESWSVSDDGLTYTFTIRKGMVWVDSQCREVAEFTADDYVAGMQHAMDAQGGLEYLVQGVLKNATEYISGEITDFSQVGVSAPDDYTLVYTLEKPCTYFLSMLSYGIFAPMSRSYYESQGGKFGQEFDDTAENYLYGTDQDHIAYCGAYVCTNATENNSVVFEANPSYWDADNVIIKNIHWMYNDESDATKGYSDFKNGDLSYVTINSSSLEVAKSDGYFEQYVHVTDNGASSRACWFNLNRKGYANMNDASACVSTKTDEQKEVTKAAMLNLHFRQALSSSIDKAAYNAQVVGEDLKLAGLINSYTPWNFVITTEEVTVDINGTAVTFPAGTYYGEIEQAQLTADGSHLTVYDPEADNGNGSGVGFDGWYDPEYAKTELALAIEELAEEGITVDAENPIVIDYPYDTSNTPQTNRANALKQSVEAVFSDGTVVINLIGCASKDELYYSGYYIDYGYEANYDLHDISGWGPDYGDPCTYLDTIQPDYAGYMVMLMGLF